ncbi:hypothetical protein MANES_06G057701v8 [Manihot esculenta]|uniref:Uncharacterized protein n=1 Tax=Manihot esculenta TaxID=3983 RepID=A0ACB7HH08_MANES|nr:hypothetical protein MANES_06G057701v8 [Manihot esculenta]
MSWISNYMKVQQVQEAKDQGILDTFTHSYPGPFISILLKSSYALS